MTPPQGRTHSGHGATDVERSINGPAPPCDNKKGEKDQGQAEAQVKGKGQKLSEAKSRTQCWGQRLQVSLVS
ncbi:hypothetical protein NT017_07910 [Prolixibacter sp. NT017]|nr:hypothetical protein NT017_07910 [Prolixibacter sp. NT017]